MPKSALEARYLADIKDAGVPAPVREFVFHPTRKWRVDAIWKTLNLVVEIEGIGGRRSRHTTKEGYTEDCEKYNALMEWGVTRGRPVTLLRFTGPQVNDGTARETTKRVFALLGGELKKKRVAVKGGASWRQSKAKPASRG